ncbi:MAG: VOC family protein, partial [Actinomycetota bacterium]
MSRPQIKQAPFTIAAATAMGPVHLKVTDGDQALRFYRDYLGLTQMPSEEDEIAMGAHGLGLVVLHRGADGPVPPRTTGLYHLAIVVPGRKDLARAIARLAGYKWPQSPTDHVMTKSNYIWDPDGNGIEIYTETPEDGTWSFSSDDFYAVDKDGRRRSGRDPIDLEELLGALSPDDDLNEPMPGGTKMGHVHLHVADLAAAVAFYHGLIGFDVMGQMSSAAFVSAGGYHHHLGLNTWAGRGAQPGPAGASGLMHFTIELPGRVELDRVLSRLD